jgi:hypothetical protein
MWCPSIKQKKINVNNYFFDNHYNAQLIFLSKISMYSSYFFIICFTLIYTFDKTQANNGFKREKTHFKKDPLDYSDRDVDSLYEEWEVKFLLFFYTLKIRMNA